MLRDDAIRAGLLKPTKEDIERMGLPEDYEVADLTPPDVPKPDVPKPAGPIKTKKKKR